MTDLELKNFGFTFVKEYYVNDMGQCNIGPFRTYKKDNYTFEETWGGDYLVNNWEEQIKIDDFEQLKTIISENN